MKRLFIFALMTMAASSSFAISDILTCSNGRVNITTARYMNDEKNLRLMAHFMVDDTQTFHAIVTTPSRKTFVGKTSDGLDIKFVQEDSASSTWTLTIEGLPKEDDIHCIKPGPFPM